jgi:hypothetical protein
VARELIDTLPYVKRRDRLFGRLLVGAMLVTTVPAVIGFMRMLRSGSTPGLELALWNLPFAVVQFAAVAEALRWHSRFTRALRRADFRLCPNCAYDYRGTGGGWMDKPLASIRCPECGHDFMPDRAAKAWRLHFRTASS